MKMNWIVGVLVLAAILIHGLVGVPPSPIIPLGESVTISEGSSIYVSGEGLKIDVLAVGLMWYVDGGQAIFAELAVTYCGEKVEHTVKLGRPLILQNLQIEMLAGDFRHHCTLRVTGIEASSSAAFVANK